MDCADFKVNENDVIQELSSITLDTCERRNKCDKCDRPSRVCFCPFLPRKPIRIKNKLFIFQHPSEEKRCLRTAKILELSFSSDSCKIIKGKKFTTYKHPDVANILKTPERTLLLFPGNSNVQLNSIDTSFSYNIIIIDGTWAQARSIYHNSRDIHAVTKVEISFGKPSSYVIRTQPTEESLSTVETAALALSYLENDPTIYQQLNKPLKALCEFQLNHGAVRHFSKEYMILNGIYKKQITQKIKKKLIDQKDIKNLIR